MSRLTKSQTIDGTVFTVTQLPSMRSLKLMHRLMRVTGPALFKLAGGGKSVSLKDVDLSAAGEAAQLFFGSFSDNDLEALTREILDSATVDHEGRTIPLLPVFDLVMAGKVLTIFKLLWFALEVNYGDFFGAFLANSGAALAGKASP